MVLFCILCLCCFGSPPRRPKRRPRGPKTPPRAPREAPRGRQEHPRRPQEEPKTPEEPVKRAQDPPRSPQKARKEHYPKDDCAYQCCRYRRDRQRQNTSDPRGSKKGTGGRRCSPLGEAIRRHPKGRSVSIRNFEIVFRLRRIQRIRRLCRKRIQTRSDPSGGGELPPPRGNTAARPTLVYCHTGKKFFVFIDLYDICNIDMRNCLGDSVSPSLRRLRCLLEPLGAILEGLEPS